MSQIRATTISDAAGTGPITLTGQSAAKAYCIYRSSITPLVEFETFNVSSIVDNAVGSQNVNFSNAWQSADSYLVLGNSSWRGMANPEVWTSTYVLIYTTDTNFGTLGDRTRVYLSFDGDLA